jgi:hypothetical protein
MALTKQLQFIVAGFLVLYIVFLTRPAPPFVVNLLASPVSQLVALGVVVYIGASVSLLVAVVAALAVALSIPAREYAGKSDDATMKKPDAETSTPSKKKSIPSAAPPPAAVGTKKSKTADSGDSHDNAPEPAGDKAAPESATKGSEKFTLEGAPF